MTRHTLPQLHDTSLAGQENSTVCPAHHNNVLRLGIVAGGVGRLGYVTTQVKYKGSIGSGLYTLVTSSALSSLVGERVGSVLGEAVPLPCNGSLVVLPGAGVTDVTAYQTTYRGTRGLYRTILNLWYDASATGLGVRVSLGVVGAHEQRVNEIEVMDLNGNTRRPLGRVINVNVLGGNVGLLIAAASGALQTRVRTQHERQIYGSKTIVRFKIQDSRFKTIVRLKIQDSRFKIIYEIRD